MISVEKDFSLSFPFNVRFVDSFNNLFCNSSFNDHYYKHNQIKNELENIYGNKCAYCESILEISGHRRIDHYRPKENIKDIHGKELNNHKGYFWLAYEWSNLLSCCEICNGHKSNYFPLLDEENRVPDNHRDIKFFLPKAKDEWNDCWQLWRGYWFPKIAPLLDEKRLLLNPELDEVENHFYYKIDGSINSDTEEGKTSIRIYDLNRKTLRLERKKVIDSNCKKIDKCIKRYEKPINIDEFKEDIIEILYEIVENDSKEDEFHGLKNYLILNFEYFFLNREIPEKELIKEIYMEWLLA